MTVPKLYQLNRFPSDLKETDPKLHDAIMLEMREQVVLLSKKRDPDSFVAIQTLKYALPSDLWEQYFSDLNLPSDKETKVLPTWLLIILGLIIIYFLVVVFSKWMNK